jgi:GAF domain-containing protein
MRRPRPSGDVQPMLAAIAKTAASLCEANDAAIFLVEGDQTRLVARYGRLPTAVGRLGDLFPLKLDFVGFRAIVERRTIHVRDLAKVPRTQYRESRVHHLPLGVRTMLATPLLRAGVAIGSIAIRRTKVRPFTPKQIALLKTFADQAAIAIENARLSQTLEARNADLTEALEQQTATSEILRVISRSPTDVQPTFDAIAASATRLCDAANGLVMRFDGQLLHLAAHHNVAPERLAAIKQTYPIPPDRRGVTGRVVMSHSVVHVADVTADPEYALPAATTVGYRSVLGVPMLRDGMAIGAILVARDHVAPFSDNQIALLQTFADQAVIAIENVRLFAELGARNSELRAALEQQTATGEILRVISGSPTDEQPVFEAIVDSARQLCEATYSTVLLTDTGQIRVAAVRGLDEAGVAAMRQAYPRPIARDTTTGRAVLDRRLVHIADSALDPEYTHPLRDNIGLRSILSVPIFREGLPIGAISVWRPEPRPFTDTQIALLHTFAEQAVIALENVRLFKELEARNRDLTVALEQQTATSEILRVISSSPTDLQPIFDAIASSATRLCEAAFSVVFRFDGELITVAADDGRIPGTLDVIRSAYPSPPGRQSMSALAILGRRVICMADAQASEEYPHLAERARAIGYRSILAVPMLRGDEAIGAINVARLEAIPFTDTQIALLQTFADQAVIAIENVRLFKELESRNSDLTVTLEQQTATSEILGVISSSPTDVQPVFDAIVRSAARLCEAEFSAVARFDEGLLHLVAMSNMSPKEIEAYHSLFPLLPHRGFIIGRAFLDGRPVHVEDVEVDPDYDPRTLEVLKRAAPYRTFIGVPILRNGEPIGAIGCGRREVRPFSDSQIELVKIFADQAVIAIENVRLFKELQARTGELTRSVEQLTALGQVSHALSSTLDVETVLHTIVSHASELAGGAGCAIYEYDEAAEQFELRATHGYDAGFVEALRGSPLRKGEGLMGRAAEVGEAIQVPDISQPGAYESSVRDTLMRFGYRALLSVPLLREEQIIGSLSLTRKEPGEYSLEVIEVLKTFATQSALAIQNARLFREIADKSRQLEVASRHKSEFLANMSHELRTPLNAIIGFSEVLNERMFGDLNEKQEEYLKDIHASGQHLLSLINDILDLSKIEAGRMELELTDFDLPMAIDNALTLVRERASRRGVTLTSTVGERVGAIRGDERKIKQVLLNLLSNAIKFTPEGGRIEVGAAVRDGAVEVSVSDTGVGIAPEDLDAVFEEFRQVGASAAKQEGTGLGLALTRKFIELHGGTIRVTSQIGAGSTFTFCLPARA